jgi:hypothetical protein
VLFSEAPHFDANAPSEVGQLEYDVMKLHAMGSVCEPDLSQFPTLVLYPYLNCMFVQLMA